MRGTIGSITVAACALAVILASPAVGQSSATRFFAVPADSTVVYRTQPGALRTMTAPPVYTVRSGCGFKATVGNAGKALAILAAPVAVIAAIVSPDDRGPAALGAMAGATLYVTAASVGVMTQRCSSTSGLIYIWTPLAAVAGAVVGAAR